MQIELSEEEIEMIIDDSTAMLESCHRPPLHDCGDMSDCPLDHFDHDISEEIAFRQAFNKKLDQLG